MKNSHNEKPGDALPSWHANVDPESDDEKVRDVLRSALAQQMVASSGDVVVGACPPSPATRVSKSLPCGANYRLQRTTLWTRTTLRPTRTRRVQRTVARHDMHYMIPEMMLLRSRWTLLTVVYYVVG
jgi:hypothetical protein